ncbi:MAG TPA: acylphosphatase [Acidimicrobiales bacterium]|nr:acylphosphatase [Acidimicrobiales bacterium]
MTPGVRGSATVRRRVVVHGHVQAVGFRASCLRRAAQAGLGGWVRNTERGDVEAVFEGPPSAVDALVAWCREGPPWAAVDDVEVSDEPTRGETAFSIR